VECERELVEIVTGDDELDEELDELYNAVIIY
jgi:hypothetical protein